MRYSRARRAPSARNPGVATTNKPEGAHHHATEGPWREVGYVAGVHGLGGELVFRAHHPASTALLTVSRVELRGEDGDCIRARIVARRPLGKGTACRIEGVNSRDAADRWRRASIWVAEVELPSNSPAEVFLEDLRGFRVCDGSGAEFGAVAGFIFTTIDIIVVRDERGQELLLPVFEDTIDSIDEANRILVVQIPEGLLAPGS